MPGSVSAPKAFLWAVVAVVVAWFYAPSSLRQPILSFLASAPDGTPKAVFSSQEDFLVIGDTIHCPDLAYHVSSNTIYTACDDAEDTRFGWFPPLKNYKDPGGPARVIGSLRMIDVETMKATKLDFENYEGQLVTHGIDVIDDPEPKNGKPAVYIFALNHSPNARFVEFMQDPALEDDAKLLHKSKRQIEVFYHVRGTSKLTHVRTIRDDSILMPNDIFAETPKSIYITSDPTLMGSATTKSGDTATAIRSSTYHIKLSQLWEVWDPESHLNITVASNKLQNNNGIGHGQTKQEVLITSMTSGVMLRGRFSPTADSRRITYIDEFKLPPMVGNPSYFRDPYADAEEDASGYIVPSHYRALERTLGQDAAAKDDSLTIWQIRKAKKGGSASWTREGNWEKRILFEDDGSRIRSANSAVVVPIDPKLEDGLRKGWLVITGVVAKNIIAVKVDL